MASWIIHLRIADKLLDQVPGLDATAFVVGNIAPDSGIPNADGTTYTPSKAIMHYKKKRNNTVIYDVERFANERLSPNLIQSYTKREFSFYLGYWAHLMTDQAWVNKVCLPAFDRYGKNTQEERNALVSVMKHDWYDLDFRYLRDHPDFRAFLVYSQASDFNNDFMPIFPENAFELRRQSVCAFYSEQRTSLDREYPYLSPQQADSFVDTTTQTILTKVSCFRFPAEIPCETSMTMLQ